MPDHLGRDRSLVDEDEARRVKLGLLDLQLGARRSDIRTILFGRVQSFFERDVMAFVDPQPPIPTFARRGRLTCIVSASRTQCLSANGFSHTQDQFASTKAGELGT